MQDGCSGSQRLSRLQTRVREEIQLVAELPNVKETPHGGSENASSRPAASPSRTFAKHARTRIRTRSTLPRRSLPAFAASVLKLLALCWRS